MPLRPLYYFAKSVKWKSLVLKITAVRTGEKYKVDSDFSKTFPFAKRWVWLRTLHIQIAISLAVPIYENFDLNLRYLCTTTANYFLELRGGSTSGRNGARTRPECPKIFTEPCFHKRPVAMAFGVTAATSLTIRYIYASTRLCRRVFSSRWLYRWQLHCVYTRRTYTYVSTYDHQLPPLSLALHPSKYKESFSSVDGMVYWSLRRKQELLSSAPLHRKYKGNISVLQTIAWKYDLLR